MISLKQSILSHMNENEVNETLHLKKGGKKTASSNISKATNDFSKSNAPQFRGKSKAKRHSMAIAAGLGAARGEARSSVLSPGSKAIHEHKEVRIQSINESTGMALVKFANRRDPIIVRISNLQSIKAEQLDEGFIGMAPIGPTYREASNYGFVKLDLDPEDIGLFNLREDDETGEKDEQEEDHDNGSNVRHDGHTGKTEIDNLPTPSDTIVPAYSDEKAPKEVGTPLSIEPGAEESLLWQKPNWDGYDYPADSPEIPTADFEGEDGGNARAPHFNSDEHQPGDGQEDRSNGEDKSEEDEEEDEEGEDNVDESYVGEDKWIQKTGVDKPGHRGGLHRALGVPQGQKIPQSKISRAQHSGDSHLRHMAQFAHNVAEGSVTDPARKKGNKNLAKMRKNIDFSEQSYAKYKNLLKEMGDVNQSESGGDTVTLSLSAMAAVLVTVCNRQPDEHILKTMIDAFADLGKTVEMGDLDSVADTINSGGAGCDKMMDDGDDFGSPDHDEVEIGVYDDDGDKDADDHGKEDHETWRGDETPAKNGKKKLFGGESDEVEESYNNLDVMEGTQMTEDEVIKMVRRRAGLKYLPGLR